METQTTVSNYHPQNCLSLHSTNRVSKKVNVDVIHLKEETSTKLFFKNMVCIRCIMFVEEVLTKLDLRYSGVQLGEVVVKQNISTEQYRQLKSALLEGGLELMDDKKAILVEKIENEILEMIYRADELPDIKYSNYLSKKLGVNYTYLADIFSTIKGISILQFIINHKIEKVKELLLYDELSLVEISYKLQYCSSAHLSKQFKKVTGLSPSFFKSIAIKKELC